VRLPALRRGHPGRLHALADSCRGLGLLGGERTGSLRVHLDAQVDPIQQRARQLAEVSALGHASGESATTIATTLGVSRATVYRVLGSSDN
jgi:DNA invertase Pin-like site-specific DNA recombinase